MERGQSSSPLYHFPLHRNILWDRSHSHILSKITLHPHHILPPLLIPVPTLRDIVLLSKNSSQFEQTLRILSLHQIPHHQQCFNDQPLQALASSAYYLHLEAHTYLKSKVSLDKWTACTVPYAIQKEAGHPYDACSAQTLLSNLGKSIRLSSELSFKSIVRTRCTGILNSTSLNWSATLRYEIFLPNVSLQLVRLDLLPIQSTDLSLALLESSKRNFDSFDSGYLTLTQTRRVVLLHESDVTVSSIPIVGVWVAVPSIALSKPNLATKLLLSHPVIWCACVRYLYTVKVRDRVHVDSNTFLMVT